MNEITKQYQKALELHGRICVAAQGAQSYLWEMCSGLKEMRDGKLYKELGYRNFEEYCEKEHDFSRQNARRYISIVENINPENVKTFLHFGSSKLYLLSTLSESEQEKITAENDVEDMTVKELEAEIKRLKADNDRLSDSNDSARTQLDIALKDYRKVNKEKQNLRDKVDDLESEIKDLRSRPIEVAVQEPSEDVRQLKLTIKTLERNTEEQLNHLQEEHDRDVRELHQQHDKEQQEAIAQLTAEYEEKLKALQSAAPASDVSEREAFKAYYSAAYDAFDRMIIFAAKSDGNREFYRGKIRALISTFENANRVM